MAVGAFRHGAPRFGTRETSRYVESRPGAKIEMKTPGAFRGRPAVPSTAPGVLGDARRVLGRGAACWDARRVLGRGAACWDVRRVLGRSATC